MKAIRELLETISTRLGKLAQANAVMAEPISMGDEVHVIPLCEVSVGFGSGGGTGVSDGDDKGQGVGEGTGGGGGGGARVEPVAVLVIDQQGVRLEELKQ